MFGLGSQELMIILLISLLLFGAQKLPELARGLGKSVKEFKKATESDADPAPSTHAAAAAARTCAGCKAPLETDWAHCPKCGAAVPQPSARPGQA